MWCLIVSIPDLGHLLTFIENAIFRKLISSSIQMTIMYVLIRSALTLINQKSIFLDVPLSNHVLSVATS